MTTTSAFADLAGTAAPAPPAGTPPAGTPAAPAPPAANGDNWFSSAEEGLRTWIAAKGFKDPLAVADSAWNLEKLIGHEKAGRTLVLPKDDATPEEIRAFQTKLGVPETPDGYKLPVPQGADDAFSKVAATWMHKAGIPPKQAEMVASEWNAFAAKQEADYQKQLGETFTREKGETLTEWGPQADANGELMKRAMLQFLPGKDDQAKLELGGRMAEALGMATTMKVWAAIGKGLGEARVVDGGGGGGSGFAMNPEQAKQQIRTLQADKAWTAAYLSGDAAKKAEFDNLFKMAYPESQQ